MQLLRMYILTPEKLKPWGLGAAIENAISNAETKTVDNFIVSKNIECSECKAINEPLMKKVNPN